MEIFQPKLVLVLTSRRSYEFLSSHPLESSGGSTPHTLRALQSGGWELDPIAPSLESPNTIIGEPAAGISL